MGYKEPKAGREAEPPLTMRKVARTKAACNPMTAKRSQFCGRRQPRKRGARGKPSFDNL